MHRDLCFKTLTTGKEKLMVQSHSLITEMSKRQGLSTPLFLSRILLAFGTDYFFIKCPCVFKNMTWGTVVPSWNEKTTIPCVL